ncbi:MAG: hypothetical protein K0A95_07855 [Chromatiales bacterium]|nr:lipoprotein [Gammaproteobacteria bacterium]MBW6476970.1 hypothetical protein [Chromatiales bacterium]
MRFCWAQYSWWGAISLLGLLGMFSGCGAKGDLFMPEEPSISDSRPSIANDVPSPQ